MMRGALAAGLLAAALAGCASTPIVSLTEPTRAAPPGEYLSQVARWTRVGDVRAEFDDALQVGATLLSPEFRAAYADKYIAIYHIGPELQAATRSQLLGDDADSYEFHLETATHNYQVSDFGSPHTVWRVALSDGHGHELLPKQLVATGAPRTLETKLYPYATVFSRPWRARFSRTLPDGTPLVGADTRALTLRISGPGGSVDLVWRLQ